jgi:hypothetical protein
MSNSKFSNLDAVLDALRKTAVNLVPAPDADEIEATRKARVEVLQGIVDKLQNAIAVLADGCMYEHLRIEMENHAVWLADAALGQLQGMRRDRLAVR